MNVAVNDPQRLICDKNQPNKLTLFLIQIISRKIIEKTTLFHANKILTVSFSCEPQESILISEIVRITPNFALIFLLLVFDLKAAKRSNKKSIYLSIF